MTKLFLALTLFSSLAFGQRPAMLPPVRQQAEMQQQWLQLRLDRHLPKLMRKYGVKMWLVVSREYNEDPVFQSLVSPTVFAARRRTIYMFVDKGDSVERLALGGGSNGGLYTVYRDPGVPGRELYMDSQWQLLRELVDEKKPATIAVNISRTHAFSDGLSAGEWEQLQQALGADNMKKVVRAEESPITGDDAVLQADDGDRPLADCAGVFE